MKKIRIIFLFCGVFYCACRQKNAATPVVNAAVKDTLPAENCSYPWEILWGAEGFIWIPANSNRISDIGSTVRICCPTVQKPL